MDGTRSEPIIPASNRSTGHASESGFTIADIRFRCEPASMSPPNGWIFSGLAAQIIRLAELVAQEADLRKAWNDGNQYGPSCTIRRAHEPDRDLLLRASQRDQVRLAEQPAWRGARAFIVASSCSGLGEATWTWMRGSVGFIAIRGDLQSDHGQAARPGRSPRPSLWRRYRSVTCLLTWCPLSARCGHRHSEYSSSCCGSKVMMPKARADLGVAKGQVRLSNHPPLAALFEEEAVSRLGLRAFGAQSNMRQHEHSRIPASRSDILVVIPRRWTWCD